jgi:leucyl/phenylalanyl-tRNA---protein transferase
MFLLAPDVIEFPEVRFASRDGLLAVGGDMSIPRLLLAYRSGIFPWTDDPLTWWSPNPRAIFDLETYQPPRRLADKMKKKPFELTFDRDFAAVISNCSRPAPGRETTWISPSFIRAYTELHKAGHAHSVEAWQDGELAGGVYGVCIGGFFAGESMFYRVTDASKIALTHLLFSLRDAGFRLFDTQVRSPLTERLGAIEIPRTDYLRRLAFATALDIPFPSSPR